MHSREIPSSEWVDFGDSFSRAHLGWPTTIEVIDNETGPQQLTTGTPFQGMSFDTAGTEPSSLEISAGDDPLDHLSHLVQMPLHIRLAENDAGTGGTLQIEPSRGPQTLVHFHRPA
jgi:hypothetical protein